MQLLLDLVERVAYSVRHVGGGAESDAVGGGGR